MDAATMLIEELNLRSLNIFKEMNDWFFFFFADQSKKVSIVIIEQMGGKK